MNSFRHHQLQPRLFRQQGLVSLVVTALSMVCLLGVFTAAAWHAGSPFINVLTGIAARLI